MTASFCALTFGSYRSLTCHKPLTPGVSIPMGRFTAEPSSKQSSISFINKSAACFSVPYDRAHPPFTMRSSTPFNLYVCAKITRGANSPLCILKFDLLSFTFHSALFFFIPVILLSLNR